MELYKYVDFPAPEPPNMYCNDILRYLLFYIFVLYFHTLSYILINSIQYRRIYLMSGSTRILVIPLKKLILALCVIIAFIIIAAIYTIRQRTRKPSHKRCWTK